MSNSLSHFEQFKKFLTDVQHFDYVIMRGYHSLPKKAGDIDIVFRPEDYDKIIDIAKFLNPLKMEDYGFAEWCDMKCYPHYTKGETKKGRYRFDIYNSIYFLSPMNDYTTNWTISENYFSSILEKRISKDYFYIPSPQDEIVLTIMRAVLDKRGWKSKYIGIIKNLLNNVDKTDVIQSLTLSTLPDPEHIYKCLIAEKYEEIVTWE